MNKFIILGDLHWGCRNASPIFFYHFKKFYDFFFDYVDQNQIDRVYQLGDVFDNRKHCNLKALKAAKEIFFDPLHDRDILTYILVGNHDAHHRNTLDINSPELILGEYSNIRVISQPGTIQEKNDTTIDMIPWICQDNEDQILDFISSSKSDLCFGHFEMKHFEMYRGMVAQEGLDPNIFAKYELVCSGHFHTKSRKENILYTGTPYELTWQDFNDPKGFWIFDVDTRKIEFILNPHTTFVRLDYIDDIVPDISDIDLVNKFVKILCVNKTDLYKFDQFLTSVQLKNPYEINIVENTFGGCGDVIVDDSIDLEDTLSVLDHYIDSVETTVDKARIKTFMNALYTEALNIGVV